MPFKYLLIATFGALLFINYSGTAATTAADLSQKKQDFCRWHHFYMLIVIQCVLAGITRPVCRWKKTLK